MLRTRPAPRDRCAAHPGGIRPAKGRDGPVGNVTVLLSEGADVDSVVAEMRARAVEVPRDSFGHVEPNLINPGAWFGEQFHRAARHREGEKVAGTDVRTPRSPRRLTSPTSLLITSPGTSGDLSGSTRRMRPARLNSARHRLRPGHPVPRTTARCHGPGTRPPPTTSPGRAKSREARSGGCVRGPVPLRGTSATAFDPERMVRDRNADRFELSAQPRDPLIGQTQRGAAPVRAGVDDGPDVHLAAAKSATEVAARFITGCSAPSPSSSTHTNRSAANCTGCT
jgi:hypothetical protein